MSVRITTLSGNTASMDSVLGEWGLSILVETEKISVLLDTGNSITAAHNADVLGYDLSRIDKIILSHGHYDHTSGLRQILQKMRKEIEIIAHPDIWQAKYVRRDNEPDKYLGIPFQRNELESLGARFNLTAKPVKITDAISTTGEIPMVTSFEQASTDLFVKEDSGWQQDKLLDDLAIIIDMEPGLVVILGGAHRGIINTLYHARQLTGRETIYTVIIGSLLIHISEEELQQTVDALRELHVQRLGLCQFTDLPVTSVLAQEFGGTLFFNSAGSIVDLP
jgi:7,8-dihydropterin-6-yl-methyl-4-(beta-D-ribofuranosyl)aminobenzene 5'-phosphate synthase